MRFIQEASIVDELSDEISDDSDKDKLLQDGEFPRNPVTLTITEDKYKDMRITMLSDIKFGEEPQEGKETYKLRFQVIAY